MGLAPIPSSMLRNKAAFFKPTTTDRYQNATDGEWKYIDRVHLQMSTDVIKGPDNTEQQLKGILFIDARKSVPAENWATEIKVALAAGADLQVTVLDEPGRWLLGNFTVLDVIDVPDVPANRTHHWEILLV